MLPGPPEILISYFGRSCDQTGWRTQVHGKRGPVLILVSADLIHQELLKYVPMLGEWANWVAFEQPQTWQVGFVGTALKLPTSPTCEENEYLTERWLKKPLKSPLLKYGLSTRLGGGIVGGFSVRSSVGVKEKRVSGVSPRKWVSPT